MEHPNLDYIKKLSGGDEEFQEQIYGVLCDEFPLERLSYERAINNGDLKDSAAKVHKLKHKISILGLEEGYQAATDFEKQLRGGNLEGQAEFESVLDKIERFINN